MRLLKEKSATTRLRHSILEEPSRMRMRFDRRSPRLGKWLLLPLLSVLALLCPSLAGVASAGVHTWTTNGPAGVGIFVSALAIDPSAPATLYASTDSFDIGRELFKSTDGGESWTDSLLNEGVFAVAIDPSNSATLYAGTTLPGGVFKSADGGASWSAVNAGLHFQPEAGVSTIAINPSTPATLYAGTSDGSVFKSTNGATSWSVANAGLTATRVQDLIIDPLAPATLYAGTSLGIFKSVNGAGSWSPINTGLTNTDVLALAIDPANS